MSGLLSGAAGLIGGICLATAVLYLVRIPGRIKHGIRVVDTRLAGYLVLLSGSMTFVAWLVAPWFTRLLGINGVAVSNDWLSYLFTLAIGVILVEIGFYGGRTGWLGEPATKPKEGPGPTAVFGA